MGAINKNAQLELCHWLSVIQSIYVFTVAVYITESRTYTMNYEVFQEDCGSLRKVSDYFTVCQILCCSCLFLMSICQTYNAFLYIVALRSHDFPFLKNNLDQ